MALEKLKLIVWVKVGILKLKGLSNMAERKKRNVEKKEERPVDFIHTGSTCLNLALSNRGKDGGWARGRIDNVVGDGGAGKTLIALEACANVFYHMLGTESHNFPKVEKVSVVYNNVEGVMDFPIDSMYGSPFNEGVEWMRTGVIQEFGWDFMKRVRSLKDGHMLFYVIDSWDALDSEEELKAFIESIEKEKPQEGSYDLGKQKYGSKRFFKTLCSEIEGDNGQVKKDCTLLIVSQTRQKIGVIFGEKQYRAGGDALNFYTHQVLWLKDKGKIYHTKDGIIVVEGMNIKGGVRRNKTAKPFREANFPILFDHGIDDIMSMVQFLHGPASKEVKDFFGSNFKTYETLANYVDKEGLEGELVKLTEEKWHRIQSSKKHIRKRRFPE